MESSGTKYPKREMNRFLEGSGSDTVPANVAPMPERETMLDDTQIGEADIKWCRSVI